MKFPRRDFLRLFISVLLIGASIIPITVFSAFASNAAFSTQKPSLRAVTPQRIAKLEALHAQAEEFIVMNELPDAIKTYEEIILFEPDDETAYTGLGNVCLTMGFYKKAHDAFKTALSINPKNETAIIGIQKILDPDGLEGMVTSDQAEGKSNLPPDKDWNSREHSQTARQSL